MFGFADYGSGAFFRLLTTGTSSVALRRDHETRALDVAVNDFDTWLASATKR